MATVLDPPAPIVDEAPDSEPTPKKKVQNLTKADRLELRQYSIASVIWLVAIHIGAIFAIWTFTWEALVLMLEDLVFV